MPYIDQVGRNYFKSNGLDALLLTVQNKGDISAGDLNYIFTTLCHSYIDGKGEKYQHYNDLIGALEGCKLELYRRQISSYEDLKISENGDV